MNKYELLKKVSAFTYAAMLSLILSLLLGIYFTTGNPEHFFVFNKNNITILNGLTFPAAAGLILLALKPKDVSFKTLFFFFLSLFAFTLSVIIGIFTCISYQAPNVSTEDTLALVAFYCGVLAIQRHFMKTTYVNYRKNRKL